MTGTKITGQQLDAIQDRSRAAWNQAADRLADPASPHYRKYPGTCDIDLTLLIAERLAVGPSPVTEAYEVPGEFALTEAELAGLPR
jgi:hypothetical protein